MHSFFNVLFPLFCVPFVDEESFDEIRFAAYRTAAKLLFIQNKTNCEYMVYDI